MSCLVEHEKRFITSGPDNKSSLIEVNNVSILSAFLDALLH